MLISTRSINAQNSEFSTEPRTEAKQSPSIKEKKKFSWGNFSSTVSKHTISIDVLPFMQKLDLDETRLIDDVGLIALPDDAKAYGAPFFKKLKPWKILYKYNLKHTTKNATFLRVGLLGFYNCDYKEIGGDGLSEKDIARHIMRDISFASYGLLAGIEKSYGIISTLNFSISADLGYYFSSIRYKTINYQEYSVYSEEHGIWGTHVCSEIEKGKFSAHSLFIEPSIQLEYTLLRIISLGIAANINIRYYSEKLASYKIQYLYDDGKLEDYIRNSGGVRGRIPKNENHFSVKPTLSLYVSYKF